MRIKKIIIQLGFMSVSIPLLILLFSHLSQKVTPVLYAQKAKANPEVIVHTGDMTHELKLANEHHSYSFRFIQMGLIAGIIVGRASYIMLREE